MKKIILGWCLIVISITSNAQHMSVQKLMDIANLSKSEISIKQLLKNEGYECTYIYNPYTDYKSEIWSINCDYVAASYEGGSLMFEPLRLGFSDSAPSSIISVHYDGKKPTSLSLQICDDTILSKWKNQLINLGYKFDVEASGQGNQGQNWDYNKPGKPDISIWNDYNDTYILSIHIPSNDFDALPFWEDNEIQDGRAIDE